MHAPRPHTHTAPPAWPPWAPPRPSPPRTQEPKCPESHTGSSSGLWTDVEHVWPRGESEAIAQAAAAAAAAAARATQAIKGTAKTLAQLFDVEAFAREERAGPKGMAGGQAEGWEMHAMRRSTLRPRAAAARSRQAHQGGRPRESKSDAVGKNEQEDFHWGAPIFRPRKANCCLVWDALMDWRRGGRGRASRST